MVEQLEAESHKSEVTLSDDQKLVLAIAHDEDVFAWQSAIARWMQQHLGAKVSLLQLQQALGMPLVEVWLGLLHSPQYQWELEGEFYREAQYVWISN